jgi:hypothetical protein
MHRAIALLLALGLLSAAPALGGASAEPKKRINRADQARAKAMLLRKSDLGLAVTATRTPSTGQSEFSCDALDASDLTLTGIARSNEFLLTTSYVSSAAEVYRTVAESNASWRRGTSLAGTRCAASELRRLARRQGFRLVHFGKLAFPRLAQRTAAYRLVLVVPTQSGNLRLTVDLIAIQHGRAQSALFYGAALVTPPKDHEVALARTIARRMAKAMRGS